LEESGQLQQWRAATPLQKATASGRDEQQGGLFWTFARQEPRFRMVGIELPHRSLKEKAKSDIKCLQRRSVPFNAEALVVRRKPAQSDFPKAAGVETCRGGRAVGCQCGQAGQRRGYVVANISGTCISFSEYLPFGGRWSLVRPWTLVEWRGGKEGEWRARGDCWVAQATTTF